MKQAVILQILFSFILIRSNAQDSVLATQLLQRIEQLQIKQDGIFPKGSFASYRTYSLNRLREKADINPFYTALIAMTLKDLMPGFTQSQREIAERIIKNTVPSYHPFESRKGRGTYNFWVTNPPQIFPYGGWMNLFNKRQALADDMDDTVMILLALGAPDSTAQRIHDYMQGFTNNVSLSIKNSSKEYHNFDAYSTWFGKKMPVEFDVCVLSNILYFTQRYQITWTAADSASLELIEKVLTNKDYVKNPVRVSPQYASLPVVLYHLARLMSVTKIASLEKFKDQLIADTRKALAETDHFMEAVILSTSLLKLGVQPDIQKVYKTGSLEELIEERPFYFFVANILSMLKGPYKHLLVDSGIGTFYYDCDAYNNLLVLENIIRSNEFNKSKK